VTQDDNEHVARNAPMLLPKVGACYKHGWRQLWRFILELLLIGIIAFALHVPDWGLSAASENEDVGSALLGILALAYALLLSWPLEYGVSFAFLKAARGNQLNVKDMFDVFQNYLNAVLANLLVLVIIVIGFVVIIVPGIIFMCKFAFVPYLVVDRRMDVIEAVKESWRMTRGYAWKVFLMGLLAIPIAITGLLCVGVGIIVAIMWVRLAFASLYHAVNRAQAVSDQEVPSLG
jgi:uncharacterized membrane protein